jgi:hypothetical protein
MGQLLFDGSIDIDFFWALLGENADFGVPRLSNEGDAKVC